MLFLICVVLDVVFNLHGVGCCFQNYMNEDGNINAREEPSAYIFCPED
jgi:hypothetical protein